MRPFSVLSLCLFLFMNACAHATPAGQTQGAGPSGAVIPSSTASPQPEKKTDSVRIADADGDGVADAQDGCPLDPGDTHGAECPTKWGYFFLRVVNDERLPIRAALAFQPSVNKMVVADDGYTGVLRPGSYLLRVEAPGYKPADVTFEVFAEEKALVEVELQRPPGEVR